jgi:hypothetical protein
MPCRARKARLHAPLRTISDWSRGPFARSIPLRSMPLPFGSLVTPDYYDILEVSPLASPETIRAAYKSLMQRYHPDRHPSRASAETQAKRINAAYAVLSDADQRARYDLQLRSLAAQADRQTGLAGMPPESMPGASRRPAWSLLAIFVAGAAVVAWLLMTPPAPGFQQVGIAQAERDGKPVEILIDLQSIRRSGDRAKLIMLFRSADRQPFTIADASVLGTSQVVAYDCVRRTFATSQKRLELVDGSALPLPDTFGEITPRSAHDEAIVRACAPWWKR